jgi:hypothetical protein
MAWKLLSLSGMFWVFLGASLRAEDCNRNGVEDAEDLVPASRGFVAAADYDLGLPTQAVLAADLDGDGDADVAVSADHGGCDRVAGRVKVLFNQGGVLRAEGDYGVDREPTALLAADLDGDGKLDLVTVNWADYCRGLPRPWPSSVSVLLNRGGGAFSEAVTYQVGTGPVQAEPLDVDNDGDLDLITANRGSEDPSAADYGSTVSVLKNDGRAGFETAAEIPIAGMACGPQALATADWNRDGFVDLATGTGSLLINAGDGTFEQQAYASFGADCGRLLACDLDRDGAVDLVVGTSNVVLVFRNREASSFDGPVELGSFGNTPHQLLQADLNQDGAPDLVVASIDPPSAFLNDGTAQFGDPIRLPFSDRFRVLAHDLDGDADLDLISVAGTAMVALNEGDGHFPSSEQYFADDGIGPIAVADISGDGRPDLVGGTGSGVAVIRNEGDGAFHAIMGGAHDEWLLRGSGTTVVAADFDGDGVEELATDAAVPEVWVENWLATGDFNEDGFPDLLTWGRRSWEEPFEIFKVYCNDGQGSFGDCFADSEPAVSGTSLAVGDVNGDGHLDVATTIYIPGFPVGSSDFSLFLGFGDGTFDGPFARPIGFVARSLLAADLDVDGQVDLAVTHGDSVVLFPGSGEAGATYSLGVCAYLAAAADLNGDHNPELVVALYPGVLTGDCNAPIASLRILINQGDGAFRLAPVQYETGLPRTPHSVVTADLDGDLDLDLAIGLSFGQCQIVRGPAEVPQLAGGVSILWNRGDASFEVGPGYLSPLSCLGAFDVAAGDLNGDGRVDLAAAESYLAVILNDGTPPVSVDRNRNGIPDECDVPTFTRGEANADGVLDISDPVAVLGFLFLGTDTPPCIDAADANDDGELDISDPVHGLSFLFLGGPAPPAPFPDCGADPTDDALGCAVLRC